MHKEQEQQNKKSTSNKFQLDLQLIGNEYAQYQARPELYLISKIEKNNPWPHKQIAEIIPFLEQITALYKDIPYHNITHAFDVMVHLDLYLTKYGWQQRLAVSSQKVTLMLIAAYAHDSGHEGLTNSFYKNSGHPLSLASSSPLQHMHASNLTILLQQNGLEVDPKIRQELVQMILKTDNFYHHELTESAKTLQGLSNEELRQPKNALLIQCLLLHAADLNNTAKQTELTLIWTNRLYEQFSHQNKLEIDNHLTLTCTLGSQQERMRSNISFLDHLALPLFKCIAVIEPKFQQIIGKVQKNKNYYLKSVEKFTC